jgi:hypothetical protein
MSSEYQTFECMSAIQLDAITDKIRLDTINRMQDHKGKKYG